MWSWVSAVMKFNIGPLPFRDEERRAKWEMY
jgi:hypothetical protein